MNHIALDAQDEAVKRFVLSLPVDPQGTVLELDGRPVVCVIPTTAAENGNGADGAWTDAKNARRCALIDREIAGTLTPDVAAELHRLQQEMLHHRRRVAPLALDDARRLHQDLLAKAAGTAPAD